MGLLLSTYIIFISLVALFLLALSLRRTGKEVYNTSKGFRPKVLVIIPCKGNDIELERNLKAAMNQDYHNYRAIAVVDSKADGAVSHIKAAGMYMILSTNRCRSCSGKVRAIATALSRFKNYDAYVILDSDVLTKRSWLKEVIAPLSDKKVGLSTSFPTFRPIGGFWSHVKFVWGFVGLSLMEDKATRFGWGGSLAFRPDLMSKDDFRKFSESVSDDIMLTGIAKERRLEIAYVPEAEPVVDVSETFESFMEWANRQTTLSTNGDKRLFYYGIVVYTTGILVMISSVLLSIFISPVFLLLLMPLVAGEFKAYMRSGGSLAAICIFPIMNFIYLANLLIANSMSSIKWRGKSYSIKGGY